MCSCSGIFSTLSKRNRKIFYVWTFVPFIFFLKYSNHHLIHMYRGTCGSSKSNCIVKILAYFSSSEGRTEQRTTSGLVSYWPASHSHHWSVPVPVPPPPCHYTPIHLIWLVMYYTWKMYYCHTKLLLLFYLLLLFVSKY